MFDRYLDEAQNVVPSNQNLASSPPTPTINLSPNGLRGHLQILDIKVIHP